jgi:hypothetical protein
MLNSVCIQSECSMTSNFFMLHSPVEANKVSCAGLQSSGKVNVVSFTFVCLWWNAKAQVLEMVSKCKEEQSKGNVQQYVHRANVQWLQIFLCYAVL